MAKTTALTELNGAKIMPLADSTTTTSVGRVPVTITKANQSAGGDSTNAPVGWQGVGTHNDADTILGPGGWTLPSGSGPLILIGGADSTSATEGSRVLRPLRVHEGGAQFVLPGSSLSTANAFQTPLQAVAGELIAAAATANQTLTTTLASNFGYMTDLQVNLYVTSTNASTISVLDASGGTVRFLMSFAASALGTTITEQVFNVHFSVPIRTNAAGAAFFLSTTGNTTQWTVRCNGYFATA